MKTKAQGMILLCSLLIILCLIISFACAPSPTQEEEMPSDRELTDETLYAPYQETQIPQEETEETVQTDTQQHQEDTEEIQYQIYDELANEGIIQEELETQTPIIQYSYKPTVFLIPETMEPEVLYPSNHYHSVEEECFANQLPENPISVSLIDLLLHCYLETGDEDSLIKVLEIAEEGETKYQEYIANIFEELSRYDEHIKQINLEEND